ncbi:hypothetical protein EON65_36215 [archaeon]|nr:MAG: hypothetical protein EON65_36215 [archaeon]
MSYELQSYSNRNSFSIPSDRFSIPAAGKSFVLPSIASVSVSTADEPNEASTASVATAPVEDWIEEMQRLEEMEKLAKITQESVPKAFIGDLNRVIDIFPGYQRMSIYTICEAVHYDSEYLQQFIDIINRIEGIVKLPTILFIELLIPHLLHIQCLKFFTLIASPTIADFIQTLETKQGIEIIELCKYQSPESLIRMSEEINVVGGVEMYKMYVHIRTHTYQQKHCQLCKTKRIHHLEFRMIYKENPSSVLPIPAMLSQYETHEYVHAASDCRYFSFDETLGKVYWHKHPVDLVNICNECIKQVHEGVSNISR